MNDPVLAALISAVAVESAAIISGIFLLLRNKRNHKKDNPGIETLLARMDEKLNRLKSIEEKLDDLLRR